MNVIVNGALGRMGQQVCKLLDENGLTLAAAVDRAGGEGVYQNLTDYTGPADVVIDFSNHASAAELVDYCKARNLPLVGDRKYSINEDNCDIALWSSCLRFNHPKTGEKLIFTAPPPDEFPWNQFK